jgi:hypothetical protein
MRAMLHEGPDESRPTSSEADWFRTLSPPLVVEVCASCRDVVYRTGVSADFVSWRKAAVSSSLTAVSSLPRGLSAGLWVPDDELPTAATCGLRGCFSSSFAETALSFWVVLVLSPIDPVLDTSWLASLGRRFAPLASGLTGGRSARISSRP